MRWPDHRWVNVPYTKYERRREDAVREGVFTAMAINRKYFDIDTGKFIKDKIQTIESCSLYDLFSEDQYSHGNYDKHFGEFHTSLKEYEKVEAESKFIPKDRYFDEECAQEEIDKKRFAEVENRMNECTKQYVITSNSRIGYIIANKWNPK